MMRHTKLARQRAYRSGCAMALALVAIAPAAPARAQGFDGFHSVQLGSAEVSEMPNVTTVFVRTPEVVINWVPFDTNNDGPIDFLPEGAIANFVQGGEAPPANFTVLNRILPQDQFEAPAATVVALNGRVNSAINDTTGGNIWFYTPTGLIVGPNAVFNTASLILTTNNILYDNSVFGPSGEIRFRGPADVISSVVIRPGAQVNAVGNDGYLALVAPRIEQGGTVVANGPIAYVAAEQLDMRINAGLIDLAITSGTTDGAGIVHSGSTGGEASTGPLDQQRIQMIAMPKNQALTMLLSGTIGYEPAAAAVTDGSAIILAAGLNPALPLPQQQPGLGSIRVENTVFTNRVEGYASDAIALEPTAGTIDFRADAQLVAKNAITAVAGEAESILAAGTLGLTAGHHGTGGTIRLEAQPGGVQAPAGLIDVAGALTATASTAFDATEPAPVGRSGTGGTVELIAAGGRIEAGVALVNVSATGEEGGQGGAAQGGTARILVSGGGMVSAPLLEVDAAASGGRGDILGGSAAGGTVAVSGSGGQLDLNLVTFEASGTGGAAPTGGAGSGGNIGIDVGSDAQSWDSLLAIANGVGGYDFQPASVSGSASANVIRLRVTDGASLSVTNNAFFESSALVAPAGALGTTATGGTVEVSAAGGSEFAVGGLLSTRAGARIVFEVPGPLPDVSPTLRGGTVDILSGTGSVVRAARLEASTAASGVGANSSAGTVTGGTTSVGASADGRLFVGNTLLPGAAVIDADAFGSVGPAPANATGGTALLFANGGTVEVVGPVSVSASAGAENELGNAVGTGFAAQGGTATVQLAGLGSLNVSSLTIEANGDASGPAGGTVAIQGDGGDGRGGTASVALAGSTFVSGATTVRAIGSGGNSAASPGPGAFSAGDGIGGTASLTVAAGRVTPGALHIEARGHGGGALTAAAAAGEFAAAGGAAQGGVATLSLSGGALDSAAILVDAGARGGIGMDHAGGTGGIGGAAAGGTALVVMPPGSTAILTSADVVARSAGHGGAGGSGSAGSAGGAGEGGLSRFDFADGRFTLGTVLADADGLGGAGTPGGGGVGGNAEFVLDDSGAGPGETRRIATLSLAASGLPAAGGTATAGQTLLVAQPGATAPLAIAGTFSALSEGLIALAGNGFTGVVSGPPLTIGGDATIRTSRDISLTVAPGSLFDVAGAVTIEGRAVATSGAIRSGGNASITGDGGIAMTDLQSGGTTTLRAIDGAAIVSNNLASTGLVTVLGRSVDLVSLGSLSFADADATSGSLSIRTGGNLALATTNASGAITLSSGAGLSASGPIRGASVDARSTGAMTLATVESPGTLLLTSFAGTLSADALQGGAITVFSRDDMALTSVTGSGAVNLISQLGTQTATGLVQGARVGAQANGQLSLTDVTATDAIGLQSVAGGIDARNLASTEVLLSARDAVNLASITATGVVSLASTAGTVAAGQIQGGPVTITSLGDQTLTSVAGSNAVTLSSTGGDITAAGPLSGAAIFATAQGQLSLTSATAGGPMVLTSVDGGIVAGPLRGGSIDVNAADALELGSVTGSGSVLLTSTRSTLSTGAVIGSAVTTGSFGDQVLASVSGTGAISLTSSGSLIAGPISGASVDASGQDQLVVAGVTASGAVGLRSTAGTIVAGPIIGGSVSAIAAGPLRLATISSGGDVVLTSTGSTLLADGVITGGAITTNSRGNQTLAGVTGSGAVSLTSTAGTLAAGAVGGSAISAQALGDLTLASATAPGAVSLTSTGGALRTDGAVRGGSIALDAAGDVRADGPLDAAGPLKVIAGSSFRLSSLGSGATIAVDSRDITLGAIARLATRGRTGTIALTNTGTAPSFVGGADQSGYSLSAAEMSRLFADSAITLVGRGEMVVDGFAMTFGSSGNIGAGGGLTLSAPSRVSVVGPAALTVSGSADRLAIQTGQIDVLADSGSIALKDAGGTIGGALQLDAHRPTWSAIA
jgi:hypothetical protein